MGQFGHGCDGCKGAAARALGVGHVNGGRRIALLENRLGVTLLQRTPGGFDITSAGEAVLRRCIAMEKAALVKMTDLAGEVVGHYEKHALAWDRDRQSSFWNDKLWHDRFIGRLGKGAQVLDLGCGPGRPVAQHMVECGLHVTGVDSSPTMISLCRERLPDQEWIVADMRGLALGRRFDGILAWDSFFHLHHDGQRRMFEIFADHASIGTVLMFNTGPQHGEGVGEYRGDPLYHASLSSAEYEALTARFGFHVVRQAINDLQAGGRTVWLCRRNELR